MKSIFSKNFPLGSLAIIFIISFINSYNLSTGYSRAFFAEIRIIDMPTAIIRNSKGCFPILAVLLI